MIQSELEGKVRVYKCSECGKELTEIYEDTAEGWWFHDCPHYEWAVMSTDCYYERFEECDIPAIRKMKDRKVLRAFRGASTVYLLLPKKK